jgi:hypothetical protein
MFVEYCSSRCARRIGMSDFIMDSLTVALFLTGMVAFSVGALGGFLVARSRLSDV